MSPATRRLTPPRAALGAGAVALLLAAVASLVLPPANHEPVRALVSGLLLASASVVAGLLLPGGRRLRADAWLWVLTGCVGLVAVALGGGWGPVWMVERLGLGAAFCLLPAAVVGFPGTWPALHRVVVLPLLGLVGLLVLALGAVPGLVGGLELVVVLIVLGAVWWRFERGVERRPGPDRDALRWLALALVLMLLVVIPSAFLLPEPLDHVVETAVLLGLPVAVLLGSRATSAVEIRTAAARTGGLLLALLVSFALFTGAVSGLEALGASATGVGLLGLLATGVAATFAPIRRLVDSAVERLLFGDQLDAVGAASRFAAELSAADDPVAALRELRSLLNLPYAAVVGDRRPPVTSGRPSGDGEFALPLTAAGHRVGELRLGLRPGETGPSARDRPVLRIVVPALAQALRARSLAADVAASRARVVTAVEEDRRRLRRDLHDGLGPTLTGVAYATDAARNVLRSDPGLAEELLSGRAPTPVPRSRRSGTWWTTSGRPCWTRWAWSPRCGSRPWRSAAEPAGSSRCSWRLRICLRLVPRRRWPPSASSPKPSPTWRGTRRPAPPGCGWPCVTRCWRSRSTTSGELWERPERHGYLGSD